MANTYGYAPLLAFQPPATDRLFKINSLQIASMMEQFYRLSAVYRISVIAHQCQIVLKTRSF